MSGMLPLVISLPHCTSLVPASIMGSLALDQREISEAVDLGTMEIFGAIPCLGVVCGTVSRLVIDLNRGLHQKDAKGLIALRDYHGRAVYRAGMEPEPQEISSRIEAYYLPFHRALNGLIENKRVRGLLDCHSLNGFGPAEAPDAGRKRADIVIGNNGDRAGAKIPGGRQTTCPQETVLAMASAFEREGFSVSLNYPYPGGFITAHYGRRMVERGGFALQIEINQDLFIRKGDVALDRDRIVNVRERVFKALSAACENL
jgi:N-formylglutamate amidohydrolase